MNRVVFPRSVLFFLVLCSIIATSESQSRIKDGISTLNSYYSAVSEWLQECAPKTSELINPSQCILGQIRTRHAVDAVKQLFTAFTLDDTVAKLRLICTLRNLILPCFNQAFGNGFKCLDSFKERVAWNSSLQVARSSFEYICDPQEQQISRLSDAQTLNCFDNLELQTCLTQILPVKDIVKYMTSPDQLKCQKKRLIYNCLKNELKQCHQHKAHDDVQGLIQEFFEISPCNSASSSNQLFTFLFVTLSAIFTLKLCYF